MCFNCFRAVKNAQNIVKNVTSVSPLISLMLCLKEEKRLVCKFVSLAVNKFKLESSDSFIMM